MEAKLNGAATIAAVSILPFLFVTVILLR